jgi:hypothetical protein
MAKRCHAATVFHQEDAGWFSFYAATVKTVKKVQSFVIGQLIL